MTTQQKPSPQSTKFEQQTRSLHKTCAFEFGPFKRTLYITRITHQRLPTAWWKQNNHRFLFLLPGASLTPACLCAATNLNPAHSQTEPDTSPRGGEGFLDTYQLYMPNTLFFCHLESSPKRSWKKDGSGWTEGG